MAWKVLTFLAIFALSEARPPTSEQKVKIENWLSHIGSHESEHKEVYAYPSYEFTYEVSDPHTHDFKGQHEQRKGDEVNGYYWLIQPDGYKRTVKYRADKHSGLKAHVDYTKKWEENSNREEGEGEGQEEANEEENNSAENGNEGNDQENENNENEAEGEEQNENNDGGEGEESQNEERQIENREYSRRYYLKKGHGNEKYRGELRATVGIWHPKDWNKRHRKEESRIETEEQNDENNEENSNGGENENGSGENAAGGENRRGGHRQYERKRVEVNRGSKKQGNEGRNEKRREENKKNENNENGENNEENQEEQRNQGEENGEENNDNKEKGKIIKTEYHVTIHHPKYKIKYHGD